MEVSPFLFEWLVELNIIEQNENDNFIPDDIIYLLCGGKYFDRILYSLQNAYNKYYNLHLDFLEKLKDLNPISVEQKNIENLEKFNNWKIIFDLLSHFGNRNIENINDDNIDNFSDINNIQSFNINNLDINKNYEYCNSPY